MAYGSVTSPLRKRFDRLIVAINSGTYGGTVGTRTDAFFNDFAVATGTPIKRRQPAGVVLHFLEICSNCFTVAI
ncbi:hypothetical protein BGLT_02812 [Caballeronia glathei]|jgi:hypothetical protein|nr:hypothetical protein B0G84_7314 [Paraburkholderia sp. BL8N3]CDY73440.1 hypothetical protein BGLT_02812 [Caballeronia glathei]